MKTPVSEFFDALWFLRSSWLHEDFRPGWKAAKSGLLLTICCAGFLAEVQAADQLILKSGGRVQGQLLVSPSEKDLVYRFRTSEGVEMTISRSEVEKIEQRGALSASEEYEQKKAQMPDTVEGNLELAHWCAENQMANQKRAHYERVLELDSENAQARRALGYTKMIDGQWRTSSEEMEDQGKVKVNGRWVSRQEKELVEQQTQDRVKAKKLEASIKKWVKSIGTRSEEDALTELENLRDPLAVPGLQKAYSAEKNAGKKRILIKSLGRIGTQAALGSLMQISVDENIEELRLTALDNLKPHAGAGLTEYYLSRLSPKKSTHEQINYAAYALGELKDASAIPDLIQALETTHRFQIVSGNQNGQTSAGMGTSSNGGKGMGFSMGSSVKTVSQKMQNSEVLEALKKLTGVNFLYDQQQWIHWYQQSTGGAGASIRPGQ